MANQRNQGKKEYNFDYFERMNEKQSKQNAAHNMPPSSRGNRPSEPIGNSRQQRNAAAQRNRAAAARQEAPDHSRQAPPGGKPSRVPSRGQPPGKPPARTRPQDSRGSAKPNKPKQTSSPPKAAPKPKKPAKPPKPQKPPKPKKPKPSLTPEQIRKRRRRHWIIFYICLFLAVVAAGVILSLTVLFHVTEIIVTGESRYNQEEIIQVSQLKTGGNLFLTSTEGASERMESTLPYLASAKVDRRLPGTLVIQVEDVVVAGAVEYNGGYLVLGSNGKALEQVAYLPEGCPSILGVKLSKAEIGQVVEYADPEQTKLIETMSLAAEENEFEHITQIDVSDPYNVKMVYDGRVTLKFGLPTDLDYKIRFAQSVLDSQVSATDRGSLDLSLARELSRVFFEPDYTASVASEPASSQAGTASTVSQPAA